MSNENLDIKVLPGPNWGGQRKLFFPFGKISGWPGHTKTFAREELLIVTCNANDRDWQSWLGGGRDHTWRKVQAREGGCRLQAGRPFSDSSLTHRVTYMIFVTSITSKASVK